jgi:hypothetical protein
MLILRLPGKLGQFSIQLRPESFCVSQLQDNTLVTGAARQPLPVEVFQ